MEENLNTEPGQQISQETMDHIAAFHADNQQRIQTLESIARETAVAVATIAANTACLPELANRIDSLESDRDQQKGKIDGIGDTVKMLWVVLGVAGSGVLWMGSHLNWTAMFH